MSTGIRAQSFETVNTTCPYSVEVAISEPSCVGQDDATIQLRINTDDVKATWLDLPAEANTDTDLIVRNLPAGTYNCQLSKDGVCTETIAFTVSDPPLLLAEPNNITICDDGSLAKLMKSVTGGRPPYKYDIQATNNAAIATCLNCDNDFVAVDKTTNFIVTVKDSKGCIQERQVKIEVAPRIEMQTEVEATRCAGEENGSVFIAANILSDVVSYTLVGSGDEPAEVQTDPEFSDLAPGQYTIIAEDANGCTEQRIVEVAEPTLLEVENLRVADVSCPGEIDGAMQVTVRGGNDSYRYSLDGENFNDDNTFRNLAPGQYDLFVQDGKGCSTTESFLIEDKPVPAMAIEKEDPTCPDLDDASFIVVIETVAGIYEDYDYSLDGSVFQPDSIFKDLPAGEYNVIARSETGCTFEQKVEIVAPDTPAIEFNVDDPTCPDSDDASFIVVIETVAGISDDYDYSLDGTVFQPDSVFKDLPAGIYNITARNEQGCTFEQAIEVTAPDAPDMQFEIEAPNCPGEDDASFIVVIETVAGIYEDFDYSLNGGVYQPDSLFKSLPAGTYEVTARSASGCTFTQSIEIPDAALPDINIDTQDASCPDGNDASFIVVIETVAGIYEYSADGENYQDNNTFTDLPKGEYTVYVRNENGCVFTQIITLGEPTAPSIQISVEDITCNGAIAARYVDGDVAIHGP
ncbi:MAG: hypothetical protein AAFO94_11505, partial [Bacteroidota bacterium]